MTEILPDTCTHFAQIVDALKIKSGSADFDLAQELWGALTATIDPAHGNANVRTTARIEEALVWKLLARRMLRELGDGPVFQSRSKGAASGTAAAHPGVDLLAKTYERLRDAMDELIAPAETATPATATGLPMRMMKVLEETEGFLEHALGLQPGEKSAFSPRLHRNGATRSDDAV